MSNVTMTRRSTPTNDTPMGGYGTFQPRAALNS